MSVLVKGMEMPNKCGECSAFVCYRKWSGDAGDCFCGITKNDATENEKNADCPLVEVPPHGRLIDADALEDRCSRYARDERNKSTGTNWGYAYATFESDVEDAPTIIPAEEASDERPQAMD